MHGLATASEPEPASRATTEVANAEARMRFSESTRKVPGVTTRAPGTAYGNLVTITRGLTGLEHAVASFHIDDLL
jgi:hypothetical protein